MSEQIITRREAIKRGAIGLAGVAALASGMVALPEEALAATYNQAKNTALSSARRQFRSGRPSATVSVLSSRTFKRGNRKYCTKRVRVSVRAYSKSGRATYRSGKRNLTTTQVVKATGGYAYPQASEGSGSRISGAPGSCVMTLTQAVGTNQKIFVSVRNNYGDQSQSCTVNVRF